MPFLNGPQPISRTKLWLRLKLLFWAISQQIVAPTLIASGYHGAGTRNMRPSPSQAIDLEHATTLAYGGAVSVSSVQVSIRTFETHLKGGPEMKQILRRLWQQNEGQDIAEYAVMLAVILVIVVGTIRLIGANANNVFSSVASSIQQ
jgi:Flp pilus assembly pilin Flp